MQEISTDATFLLQLSLLASKVSKRVDGSLSPHGISFTEYGIMHELANSAHKAMRRGDLAERVGLSPSGVTRLLSPMEKRKLIEKETNPRDARQSLVKLSKAGHQIYEEASESFEYCATSTLNPLSENQLAKLVELSERLL